MATVDKVKQERKRLARYTINLRELGEILDRKPNTIRLWVLQEELPGELMPERISGRQTMYWARSQLRGLRKFAADREKRRGWGNGA